ncbi:MAG TPA: GNAT family protein [Lichenihabitans sp.]|jgi:RimJ/RimL family protein N-acetyltransferase|nr:GNAT family protein [Lichenihabitans sp.]
MHIAPFSASDFAALMAWFPTEAALIQWGGSRLRFPLDEAQLEEMLAECEGSPPARLSWTGRLDGRMVAHAQVAFDARHGVALLSRVAIAPEARGQGLAAPFLDSIIDRAFAVTGVERLELNVYTFNDAALRTYRRLGFRHEGTRRSSVRVGDERWDTAIFAMLRHERSAAR